MLLKLVMKLGGSDKWKTKNKDAKGHIDLFRTDEDDISHYVCMTDCSRLQNSQKSEFHNRSCFCKYCSNCFGTKETLKDIMRKGAWKLKDNK